jgi:signal peptide peptidase SppA
MKFPYDYHDVWAIKKSLLPRILGAIESIQIDSEQLTVDIEAARATKFGRIDGKIAVLPIHGIVTHRPSVWSMLGLGQMSTEVFGVEFDKVVAESEVKAIVLDINSPGGTIAGVPELSDKIYNARGTKPIIGVVNAMSASAAFWIASAADETVIMPSGEIGSVGVVAIHTEFSKALDDMGIKTTLVHYGKYKVEGNVYEQLGDEARAEIQRRVDEYGDMFVEALARNRGVAARTVAARFGSGRMFGPAEAIDRKMADRVGTFEAVLRDLAPRTDARRRNRNVMSMLHARVGQCGSDDRNPAGHSANP